MILRTHDRLDGEGRSRLEHHWLVDQQVVHRWSDPDFPDGRCRQAHLGVSRGGHDDLALDPVIGQEWKALDAEGLLVDCLLERGGDAHAQEWMREALLALTKQRSCPRLDPEPLPLPGVGRQAYGAPSPRQVA